MSTYGVIGLGAVIDRGLTRCGDAYRRDLEMFNR